jgi:hypothetical protein
MGAVEQMGPQGHGAAEVVSDHVRSVEAHSAMRSASSSP